MKKILVPTDFSQGSKIATEYALAIAEMCNTSIVFLHIVVTPLDWVNLPLEKEKLYPETKAEIANAKRALQELENNAHAKGVAVETSLQFNKSREAIEEHIIKGEFDLVVMGSHGARGIREFMIGSNAQKVIRNSAVPVLVVKTPPDEYTFRNIVFASTYQDGHIASFQKIIELGENLAAPIHLLYINTPYYFKETEDMEYMLNSFAEGFPNNNFQKHIYNAFNEERGISNFMTNKGMDVLAIATEGKSSIKQLFSPSLTESLINHLDNPILTLNLSKIQ
ncbi:universal stress protein [Litoribacter ruber]|uniref:universal stress protein n=1 Tax=Litoribacter ruber TaxID=702568 RepID=UPI001BD96F72|nr:universal stress protein [Litoribacter ruber]MBT0812501.1 universal stress protein [Litoribacter ruber]